jgi:hypothetical protein
MADLHERMPFRQASRSSRRAREEQIDDRADTRAA